MSWTYSGNPGDSYRDELRFIIGDTDTSCPLIEDGEADFIITKYTIDSTVDIMGAAIYATRRIISKVSSRVDEKVGDVSVDWSQKAENYRNLLTSLRREQAIGNASIYAGGISISCKNTYKNDSDRVKPAFTKDFGKNRRLAGDDYVD